MVDLAVFRAETRAWLEVNCPPSMRSRMVPGEEVNGGSKRRSSNPDAYLWLERMADKVLGDGEAEVTIGALNIFDEDPPEVGGTSNEFGYDTKTHDPRGRLLFARSIYQI